MASNFINRFRYGVLAVLIIVTLAYGYYLYRVYAPEPQPEKFAVPVAVLADGSVTIEGVTYANAEGLKKKVAAIQHDHKGASFSITAPHGAPVIPIAKAVVLLQNSGAKTVTVLNEP